jgi:uncharacterized protein (DUF983 family)
MRHAHDAPPSSYVTGVTGRCPRCGGGKLFNGFLELAPHCEACGLDYGFADAGDGPAVIVTLLAGFIVVGTALVVEVKYEPPMWLHLAIFLPLTLVVCLGMLRPLKGILVSLQYRNKAGLGRLEK